MPMFYKQPRPNSSGLNIVLFYPQPEMRLIHEEACRLNATIVLVLIAVWSDIRQLCRLDRYGVPFWGAMAQLNLWADRQLIMRIVESMPPNQNSPKSLRCPRLRPDIEKHIPEHLFLVLNGLLIPEVVDKIGLSEHRPIPPRIDVLRAKWKAGFERLTYHIELTSLNLTLLHKPLLNIATSGYVPASTSDVRITLPCTGKASGIAPFRVQLDIRREFEALRKIPRISFIVYKYCLSAARQTRFIIKCECRSRCARLHPHKRNKLERKRCVRRCRRGYDASQYASPPSERAIPSEVWQMGR
ncbi:unnamed protein product [Echinostoma caproni]|uniref:WIF domain-containing protein n=1 Tax=Echinostoma caproni TaxID=27848 RepID=A0A183AAJ6_9TREM|nr:unnamed protein product [Echinostoma caproni]